MEKKIAMIIGAIVLALNVGCSSEKKSSALDASTATGTTTTTNNGSVFSQYSGSAGTVTLVSRGMLAKMFPATQANNPTNVTISIDLARVSDSIIISYTDNGQLKEARFGTINPSSGAMSDHYNGWVSQNGQQVWKGFFQDYYGAVIIIVDGTNSGDGQQNSTLSGSIWFQNFDLNNGKNPEQGPLKTCWDITEGNHDCRSYLNQWGQVDMTVSYYPESKGPNAAYNYQKLGTFTGIQRDASGF